MIVDALGNPLALSLTGGQVHDITQADALLALVEPEALLGDKGYDADQFVESLTARAIEVVIPPKSNRKVKRDCDFALYCERNIVERFFNTIKHFRAIATRYEKTARNFQITASTKRRLPRSLLRPTVPGRPGSKFSIRANWSSRNA